MRSLGDLRDKEYHSWNLLHSVDESPEEGAGARWLYFFTAALGV